MNTFKLKSNYRPTGDQPKAIEQLTAGGADGMKHQLLLGVTGSGKTFSVANVIANLNRPTLIISHNKTLAAQLYQEYKEFFPDNAVEYFVSYYDYYQPEAYLPQTDTYIEKDAAINEDIDKLRLAATTSLLTRNDVIVVASVSCIYNLGSPVEYKESNLRLMIGMPIRYNDLLIRLTQLFYVRSDFEFKRGTFRVSGDIVDIYPAYMDFAVRIEILDNILSSIRFFDPITGKTLTEETVLRAEKGTFSREYTPEEIQKMSEMKLHGSFTLYPAKHYVTNKDQRPQAIKQIREDLAQQIEELNQQGKVMESYRLSQKTNYDLELLEELGYCKGIENYSRYFDGRKPGDPPYSLLDFFPEDYLTVIDESHITIPQINGMFNGDRARKETLIDFGFRLPSALDNRPLRFEEFLGKSNQILYTSATPNPWETNQSVQEFQRIKSRPAMSVYPKTGIVEQLIRPTGITDPEIQVRGSRDQIQNLLSEIRVRIKRKERVLITTLTKRMAEDLSNYLKEQEISVQYLHADIDTLERTDILDDLRKGTYDVVVGINLLREGLDLPEVSLVAILDADKEGFLRSESSLIQTMGRAARHIEGKVILYADTITKSMQKAMDEVNRRRKLQQEYNELHNITPTSIDKPIREKLIERTNKNEVKNYRKEPILNDKDTFRGDKDALIEALQQEMKKAAQNLEFERAAMLRDRIDKLNKGSRPDYLR
ncbi:excinuclease ABC subunit UvrB [candidate division WWE3 bacterium]|nr:excinuclease ABC subunit UvrB [candidate division WWE3 bacterium]